MTLEQLLKQLEGVNTMWDLSSLGLEPIKEGLADVSKRLKALEKAAPKK
jgi:hypothetical protein